MFSAKRLSSAIILTSALAATGCGFHNDFAEEARQHDQNRANINALLKQDQNNVRLDKIISYAFSEYSDPEVLQRLIDNNITIAFSNDGMPAGAVVKIDKNRIQLDPLLPVNVQALALSQAASYINGQIRDGLEYGVGESFTIGSGQLVPVSKNRSEYQKILVPVPAPQKP